PRIRLRIEQPTDQPAQVTRQRYRTAPGQLRVQPVVAEPARVERVLAGGRLEQHRTEREQVGGRPGGLVPALLGRHERRGATRRPRPPNGTHLARDAEVDEY